MFMKYTENIKKKNKKTAEPNFPHRIGATALGQ